MFKGNFYRIARADQIDAIANIAQRKRLVLGHQFSKRDGVFTRAINEPCLVLEVGRRSQQAVDGHGDGVAVPRTTGLIGKSDDATGVDRKCGVARTGMGTAVSGGGIGIFYKHRRAYRSSRGY